MYLISTSFQNPYYGLNVWEFIITFFIRFWHFITGSLKFDELASDEVQVGTLFAISLSSAIIGSLLNLRKMSMLANSLSHTILVGIVIAFYLTTTITGQDLSNMSVFALLIGALIMGFVTSFSTEFLHKVTRLQEDASLGLVFTNFFAMGIVLVTILTRNSHIGIEAVMGNVDALSRGDLKLVFYVFIFNYIIYFVFKKELAITSFDAGLARSLGFKTGFYNYLIMSMVSITAITAFRAIGVILFLAFLTGPVLTARLIAKSLNSLIFFSAIIAASSCLIGVAVTRHILSMYGLALATSGVVVIVIFIIYFLAIFTISVKKRVQSI